MKKVYICSPCRGDYENNIQRAKEYSRAAVEQRRASPSPRTSTSRSSWTTPSPSRARAGPEASAASWCSGCAELWAFGLDCTRPPVWLPRSSSPRARGIPVRNGYEAISELKPDEPAGRQRRGASRTPAASRSAPARLPGDGSSATSTSTTAPSASSWMAASSSSSPTA